MDATLYINRNNSRCGVCGKGADPREETHETVLGYFAQGVQSPAGCGARWEFVSTDYLGDDSKASALRMRPDLEPAFID